MPQLNTPQKPNRFSSTVVLIITIVISMVLLTAWSNEGDSGFVHGTRNVVATIASPFQYVGSVISYPFRAISNGFTNAGASTEDLLTLQQENEELKAQVAQDQELQQENERLTALLGISSRYNVKTTGARVISQSIDSWNRTIVIDKGSSSGLTVGMPVMNSSGIIGQVESVSANTATVRLITDEISGVSAYLQNSRAEGVVNGSVDGLLRMEFVPSTTNVTLGEAVITSGMGGVYPAGMVVGYVSRIEGASTDTYRTIIVQPAANVEANEEVVVLIGGEASVTVSEADSSSAGSASAAGATGATATGEDTTSSTSGSDTASADASSSASAGGSSGSGSSSGSSSSQGGE